MRLLQITALLLPALPLPAANADAAAVFEAVKRTAAKAELYELLYALPKGGDIHHHFGLACRAEDWWDAASDPKQNGGNVFYTRTGFADCEGDTELPVRYRTIQRATWRKLSPCRQGEYVPLEALNARQRAEWLSGLRLDRPGEGRDEFFEAIVRRMGDLARNRHLAMAVLPRTLKRMAREGVRYLESGLSPVLVENDGQALTPQRGAGLLREMTSKPTGVEARFQYSLVRYAADAEKRLESAYEFVSRNRDLWVGVNFVGREDNERGHPLRFLDTLRKLRRTYPGIRLSIHAGEKDGPGRDVREALLLGAERIGHGVNLISDPGTMLHLRGGRVLVEIQLISNRLLEYTPDLAAHPFPEYLRTGIPVCLNTDDPGAWDSNLTDEYFTAVTTFNLSWDEVVTLGRNSLEYSFAEPALKRRLLEDYATRVSGFETKHLGRDWKEKLPRGAELSGYARRNFGLPGR